MAIVFCTTWNTIRNENTTGAAPTFEDATSIDTGIKKFGAGSLLLDANVGVPTIYWTPFSAFTLDNVGSIGYWLYFDTNGGDNDVADFFMHDETVHNKNFIEIYIDNDNGSSYLMLYLLMRNSTSSVVINIFDTSLSDVAPGWHYVELNWLWNDGSGLTELSWDGIVKLTSTAGNTKTRVGSSTYDIELDAQSGFPGNKVYCDDLTILDVRQNVGNFSVPTVPRCGAAPPAVVRPVTIGSPFGMNRLGN